MPGYRKRTAVTVLALAAMLPPLGGCIQRPDLSGPEVNFSVVVRFIPELPSHLANTVESLRIVEMRMEVRDDETREILSEGVVHPDPGQPDPDPVAEVELLVPRGVEIEVFGHLRLIGEAGRVEWSGLFGPTPISTARERWDIRVTMGRGGLPNLTVTGLSVSDLEEGLRVGETAALVVTMQGGAQDSEVLWGSQDPNVVTVDRQGRVTGISPGEGTVVATAGMHAASVVIRVHPGQALLGR